MLKRFASRESELMLWLKNDLQKMFCLISKLFNPINTHISIIICNDSVQKIIQKIAQINALSFFALETITSLSLLYQLNCKYKENK